VRGDLVRASRRLRGTGALPAFLVIGAQRGGTTTLFSSLRLHPQVGAPTRKEVHHFDAEHMRSDRWYRSFFPSEHAMQHRGERLTGEATPSYLFHPLVPERVAETIPDVRSVVLLRDPVERARSQHALMSALGFETRSFDRAVDEEVSRLPEIEEALVSGRDLGRILRVSYLSRGDYAPQLERWYSLFGRDRVHVAVSEEFFADPVAVYRGVERFLQLAEWERLGPIRPRYVLPRPGEGKSGETERTLRAHFAPRIRRVEQLLGRELPWETDAVYRFGSSGG
jgi:hypothetical protein